VRSGVNDDRVRLLPVCEPGRGPREPVEIRDEWAKRMADDLDRFKRGANERANARTVQGTLYLGTV
jgi:hypothetical protein